MFAKKTQTKNIDAQVYRTQVESFTHGKTYDIIVSREYLRPGDRVLLIDDFLANGKALEGLARLVKDAGAVLVGAGIVIEKGFQPECGWNRWRSSIPWMKKRAKSGFAENRTHPFPVLYFMNNSITGTRVCGFTGGR